MFTRTKIMASVAYLCTCMGIVHAWQVGTAPPDSSKAVSTTRMAPTALQQQERALERQYAARLAALSPANPEAYFLLAEELADGAESDPTRRRLATRLFVLAYDIARKKPDGRPLAASACLGLASVAGSARDKQFLSSLARTLDPRQISPSWVETPEVATSDSGAYRLAVLLGDVRAGEGLRARRLLEDPDVASLLDRYDALLGRSGLELGAFSVRREAGRWPCAECRNERVVRRMVEGQVEYRICPVCNGALGPKLSTSMFLGQLRFEAWLLQGSQRSWASQMGMDGGMPLIEPDPDRIGLQFAVDTSLALWRNGIWVVDPNAPKPPLAPAGDPVEPATPETKEPASGS